MRTTYRVLAMIVAALVVVQAFAIAYAVAGLGHWIDEGNTLDASAMGPDSDVTFDGIVGFMIHGMNGMMLIPLLSVALLIVSFFAKVPGGVKWAGLLVLFVAIQVTLGIAGHDVPILGGLHGLNALIVFGLAVMAALRAKEPTHVSSYGDEKPVARV